MLSSSLFLLSCCMLPRFVARATPTCTTDYDIATTSYVAIATFNTTRIVLSNQPAFLVSLFFQPASSIATSTTNNEHDDSKQSVVTQSLDNPPTAQPNLDFFGPEMADLQQLLVSMTTGKLPNEIMKT